MRKFIFLFIVGLVVFGGIIYTVFSVEGDKVSIQPFNNSWEECVPQQEIPEGLTSLSAESCGVCHQDHYEEWKLSTHAHAWTDAQFQAELKKESSPYMCINCHIPLQNQQEFIVDGLIDGDIYKPSQRNNPDWDKKLQNEGITCASCHVRNNRVVGPTGTSLAPHATTKDVDFLSESLCISCHNAVAVVTPQLACSFETGDEWKAGPYNHTKNCINCHMEEVNRSVAVGYPERKSHYHSFPGAGIPKVVNDSTGMLNGLEISLGVIEKQYSIEDEVEFIISLKNEHAGHSVPTGDPERFILVSVEILNSASESVFTHVERIGEKWEWYPVTKKISDNNLKPKEKRDFEMLIGKLDRGNYSLMVSISKHRMDQETFAFNQLDDTYPIAIEMYKEVKQFVVK